jgi:tRNA (cytidine32/uridine32-2'-O)-methyltransferase
MKRIVLCRPSGPRNVGAIVRAVANFGPAELYLVAPQRKALLVHPEFEQMSHGVEDLVARCQVVGTLAEALADCNDSVGFTARGRDHREIREWSTRVEAFREWGSDPARRLGLVFGAEVNGLSNEEADLCRELVHIETGDEHTSLNLSVAVAIVLHGLFRPAGEPKRDKATRPLEGKDLEYLIANLRHVFVEAAWTESAKRDIALSVERVLRRAMVEHRDARAWHMALRALGSTKTPGDFDIR